MASRIPHSLTRYAVAQLSITPPSRGRLNSRNCTHWSSGMSARPFRVLGLQQIAIGGPDKGRLRKLWVEMLGLAPAGTYRSERENVDEDILALGDGPTKVEVDLMQPLDPAKKPAVHETPLNHVG